MNTDGMEPKARKTLGTDKTYKTRWVSCTPELDELSHRTIGAIYEVSNELGGGFLEKVYQKALVQELRGRGIRAEAEVPMDVYYKGESVGNYYIDVLVEDTLLVELKCVDTLVAAHVSQCTHYLKASGHPLCLLVNFRDARVQCKRVVI